MRQVPAKYMIIGAGRMASHFFYYLSLLNIPYRQWSRNQSASLSQHLEDCSHVLLLISDTAIEPFILARDLSDKCLVHFSGQLVTNLAYGAHPLMTFADQLYSMECYQQIPWVLEEGSPDFSELLPGLSNPHFVISKDNKSYYHAMCVVANNFTTLLWQKFFDEMQQRFQIPKEHLQLYLRQTLLNLCEDHENTLTGPLARGDQATISANLASLKEDPFYSVYEAFVNAYSVKNKIGEVL